MDTFLTKMYEEEMDKTAGGDLDEFMQTLPPEELEQFLGINKVAVGGSVNVPLPDAAQGKEMDAKQQAARKQVDKEHNSNPAPRHEETRTTSQVTKEAADIADKAGRVLAKWASSCKSKISEGDSTDSMPPQAPTGGKEEKGGDKKEPGKLKQSEGEDEGIETTAGVKTEAIKGFLGKLKGGFQRGRDIAGQKVKAIKDIKREATLSADKQLRGHGIPAARRKLIRYEKKAPMESLTKDLAAARAKTTGVEGAARHVGEHGKKYLAGAGALTAAEVARRGLKGGNNESMKTAAAQAEIVERSLRLTHGAPDHIKQAAVMLAGHQVALVKTAKEDKDYPVKPKTHYRGQIGMRRALSASGTGGLPDPEVMERAQKSAKKGLGYGALLGALGGAGGGAALGRKGGKSGIAALIGGLYGAGMGGLTGAVAGDVKATGKALKSRGIKRTYGGFGRGRFNEEAAKKYLTDK